MLMRENCALMVVDMQEKLADVMINLENTTKNIRLLIEAANEFAIPMIYTEQYPKGLGDTIEPLKSLLADYKAKRFDKMTFSALNIPEIKNEIESLNKKTIVLSGIESHICVLSTAIDLKESGYNVVVANDAVTSRKKEFYDSAVAFYNGYGISCIPAETLVFYWIGTAGTASFKKLQKIILGKA